MFRPRTVRHEHLLAQIARRFPSNDLAHDRLHVFRVYEWALRLAPEAGADADLAGAAALVHDLVNVPKESPRRAHGGDLSADAARDALGAAGYLPAEIGEITEAVRSCAWSSGRKPGSAIGVVLQDADRLDAIGAIGIARTFATAQAMASRGKVLELYDHADPLATGKRPPDDGRFAVDHFAVKLLTLAEGMHLSLAREEALRRHRVMEAFLEQLGRELG